MLTDSTVAEQRRLQASWRSWNAMLDHVEAHLSHGEDNSDTIRALDMGCGTGEVVSLMLRRGWHCVGVDADSEMLQAAGTEHSEACFVAADISKLTRKDLQQDDTGFDLIWSSFAVQYFTSSFRQILPRWMDLLRPGGLVAIVENDGLFAIHHPQDTNGAQEFERMEDALRTSEYGYDTRAAPKIPDIMKACGMEIVENSQWEDPEFAFDGPARPEILRAWKQRLDRMKFPRECFSTEFEERKRAFLKCLASPQHKTLTRMRLIVGRKRS